MKKNAQIHLLIESELIERLKSEASEKNVSLSEICRQKLKQDHQLNRIENILGKMDEKLSIQSRQFL